MSEVASLFDVTPSVNFTRKRLLPFEETVNLILGMAGGSLNRELYDHFKSTSHIPTASAFVQARDKILPEAFQFLFHEYNEHLKSNKTYRGYSLYAADGTDLNIPTNPHDTETYFEQGYNQLHINALYDLINRAYIDAEI